MEDLVNRRNIEAYRHQAQFAAAEFTKNHWTVRMVKPEGYTQPLKEKSRISIVCGDGRYTPLFQNGTLDATQTVSLFGGGYALLELKFGGTERGLHDALALARKLNFDLRLHGDEHEPGHVNTSGCGNLAKWKEGAIPGVKPLEITPQQMLNIARSMGIQLDILKGHHEETALHLNYAPDTGIIPSVKWFREEAWAAHYLSLPNFTAFSRHTVELLGPVRDVTIIVP